VLPGTEAMEPTTACAGPSGGPAGAGTSPSWAGSASSGFRGMAGDGGNGVLSSSSS